VALSPHPLTAAQVDERRALMRSHGANGEDAWDFLLTIDALRAQLGGAMGCHRCGEHCVWDPLDGSLIVSEGLSPEAEEALRLALKALGGGGAWHGAHVSRLVFELDAARAELARIREGRGERPAPAAGDSSAEADALVGADAATIAKALRDAEDRGMAKMKRRVRHDAAPPCAVAFVGAIASTVVYLRDGTKVVLHREGNRAWLAVEPQDVITPQDAHAPAASSSPTKGSP